MTLLKPASPELIVRDPFTKDILPVDGKEIDLTGPSGKYWRRRIADGDVVIAEGLE